MEQTGVPEATVPTDPCPWDLLLPCCQSIQGFFAMEVWCLCCPSHLGYRGKPGSLLGTILGHYGVIRPGLNPMDTWFE